MTRFDLDTPALALLLALALTGARAHGEFTLELAAEIELVEKDRA